MLKIISLVIYDTILDFISIFRFRILIWLNKNNKKRVQPFFFLIFLSFFVFNTKEWCTNEVLFLYYAYNLFYLLHLLPLKCYVLCSMKDGLMCVCVWLKDILCEFKETKEKKEAYIALHFTLCIKDIQQLKGIYILVYSTTTKKKKKMALNSPTIILLISHRHTIHFLPSHFSFYFFFSCNIRVLGMFIQTAL